MATHTIALYRPSGEVNVYRGVPAYALPALRAIFSYMGDLGAVSGHRVYGTGAGAVVDELYAGAVQTWADLREEVESFICMGLDPSIEDYLADQALERQQQSPPPGISAAAWAARAPPA